MQIDASDSVCDTCQTFVSTAKDFLTQDEVIANIIKEAQTICRYYDLGDLTTECDAVAEGYVNAVLDDVEDLLDANIVCVRLMFCDSSDDSIDQKLPEVALNLMVDRHRHHHHHHHHRHHTAKSSICELSLKNVQNKIHQHNADKKVFATLNVVCSFLHVSSKQCKHFVNGHLWRVFDFIKTSNNEELCNTFDDHLNVLNDEFSLESLMHQSGSKVTTKLAKSPFIKEKLANINDMQCSVCTGIFQEIQHLLQGENWDNLRTMVEGVCAAFPENYNGMCIGVFDVLFQDIAEMIKGFDANEICTTLRFCGEQSHTKLMFELLMENGDDIKKIIKKFKPFVSLFIDVVMKKNH